MNHKKEVAKWQNTGKCHADIILHMENVKKARRPAIGFTASIVENTNPVQR